MHFVSKPYGIGTRRKSRTNVWELHNQSAGKLKVSVAQASDDRNENDLNFYTEKQEDDLQHHHYSYDTPQDTV